MSTERCQEITLLLCFQFSLTFSGRVACRNPRCSAKSRRTPSRVATAFPNRSTWASPCLCKVAKQFVRCSVNSVVIESRWRVAFIHSDFSLRNGHATAAKSTLMSTLLTSSCRNVMTKLGTITCSLDCCPGNLCSWHKPGSHEGLGTVSIGDQLDAPRLEVWDSRTTPALHH